MSEESWLISGMERGGGMATVTEAGQKNALEYIMVEINKFWENNCPAGIPGPSWSSALLVFVGLAMIIYFHLDLFSSSLSR